jgi:hypothetical protein
VAIFSFFFFFFERRENFGSAPPLPFPNNFVGRKEMKKGLRGLGRGKEKKEKERKKENPRRETAQQAPFCFIIYIFGQSRARGSQRGEKGSMTEFPSLVLFLRRNRGRSFRFFSFL